MEVDSMSTPKLNVDEDGSNYWYINGRYHREDGPAVEYASGTKLWYVNGKLHREDGPAAVWANGRKDWHLNGKLHRLDGPAVTYANGTKLWFLDDKRYDIFDDYVKAAKWTDEQIVEWKLTNEYA
jgi:hypothetical protein